MSHPYMLARDSIEAMLPLAGGKGASRARLAQARLPVPCARGVSCHDRGVSVVCGGEQFRGCDAALRGS